MPNDPAVLPPPPVPAPPQGPPETREGESMDVFDYELIRNYASFAVSAVRRHVLLEACIFALVIALAGLALVSLPKSYHAETKLLAQRNDLIESLSNPSQSAIQSDLTRAAAETVLRYDNLISLVEQTDLIRYWYQHRPPVLRLKDWVRRLVAGQVSAEDKTALFIDLLQARLSITAGEGVVTIGIDWNDPVMAYRLVEAAQQGFLEARHLRDISSITDAIAILESHAVEVQHEVDRALDELQERHAKGKDEDAASIASAAAVPRRSVLREVSNPEATRLRDQLEVKRRSIQDLESFRRQRLQELQARKIELRAVYADAHPAMQGLQQSIDSLAQDSSSLLQLRAEEAELVEKLKAFGTPITVPLSVPAAARAPTVNVQLNEPKDPASDYALNRLRNLTAEHSRLEERVNSARITLDTTRASFKYRYSVIRPPQFPREGKPTAQAVLGGGVLLGLLVAAFAAVFAELLSGEIVAGWQVERSLKLPVLAELDT